MLATICPDFPYPPVIEVVGRPGYAVRSASRKGEGCDGERAHSRFVSNYVIGSPSFGDGFVKGGKRGSGLNLHGREKGAHGAGREMFEIFGRMFGEL